VMSLEMEYPSPSSGDIIGNREHILFNSWEYLNLETVFNHLELLLEMGDFSLSLFSIISSSNSKDHQPPKPVFNWKNDEL
jgi:hypothetical protein